jgi:hypothetical protein
MGCDFHRKDHRLHGILHKIGPGIPISTRASKTSVDNYDKNDK